MQTSHLSYTFLSPLCLSSPRYKRSYLDIHLKIDGAQEENWDKFIPTKYTQEDLQKYINWPKTEITFFLLFLHLSHPLS